DPRPGQVELDLQGVAGRGRAGVHVEGDGQFAPRPDGRGDHRRVHQPVGPGFGVAGVVGRGAIVQQVDALAAVAAETVALEGVAGARAGGEPHAIAAVVPEHVAHQQVAGGAGTVQDDAAAVVPERQAGNAADPVAGDDVVGAPDLDAVRAVVADHVAGAAAVLAADHIAVAEQPEALRGVAGKLVAEAHADPVVAYQRVGSLHDHAVVVESDGIALQQGIRRRGANADAGVGVAPVETGVAAADLVAGDLDAETGEQVDAVVVHPGDAVADHPYVIRRDHHAVRRIAQHQAGKEAEVVAGDLVVGAVHAHGVVGIEEDLIGGDGVAAATGHLHATPAVGSDAIVPHHVGAGRELGTD